MGRWLDDASASLGEPLDAWVVQRDVQDPAQYAETWIRDGGLASGAQYEAMYRAWLDDLESRRVESVGFGLVTLRRPGPGTRPLRRVEELAAPAAPGLGDHLDACLAAHDALPDGDGLLAAAPAGGPRRQRGAPPPSRRARPARDRAAPGRRLRARRPGRHHGRRRGRRLRRRADRRAGSPRRSRSCSTVGPGEVVAEVLPAVRDARPRRFPGPGLTGSRPTPRSGRGRDRPSAGRMDGWRGSGVTVPTPLRPSPTRWRGSGRASASTGEALSGKQDIDGRRGRAAPPGDRGVAGEGTHHRGLPRRRLRRRGVRRAHPRPAPAVRAAAGDEEGPVRQVRRRRRQRLRALLRGRRRQEEEGLRAQAPAQGRGRALPRDRRGPRGRGHRLAPAGDPAAQGPGAPDGVPRDHPRGDPARAAGHPRHRRRPWSTPRRPAASSTGSTATRSRRCCGARSRPGCRPGACSRWPPAWWSSASASGWRSAPPPTGTSQGTFAAQEDASADAGQRFTARLVQVDGARVASGRDFDDRGRLRNASRGRARPGGGHLAGRGPARGGDLRPLGRDQAVHAPAVRALHHLDPAAGGLAQAPVLRAADDAHRAGAVRERLHHLHAHRLHGAEPGGDHGGPAAGVRHVRAGVRARQPAGLREQVEERAGGARGDPSLRRLLPHPRAGLRARCAATSSACTS